MAIDAHSSTVTDAVVVGGGVAGVAAALRLAEGGVAVTLIEAADHLGGRAGGFVDPDTGERLDASQHVLLGCCTNTIDLFRRVGVADGFAWHRTLYFADRHGHLDEVVADDLPPPLHLMRSLLSMKAWSGGEKFAIVRGLLAILQIGDRGRRYLRDISFAQWLDEHHQPRGTVRKFWSPLILSACNEPPEHVAARYGVQVFQEGLLSHEDACIVGLPRVPLRDVWDAAERKLADLNVRVLKSTCATGFDFDGHRIAAIRLSDDRKLWTDAYISALPFDRLAALSSELMLVSDARLAALAHLHVSPMVGIDLYIGGRNVALPPHVALIDSPLNWLFVKGAVTAGPLAGTTHLHGVICAADDVMDVPARDLAALALAEAQRVLPSLAGAELVHHRVTREPRATLSPRPGVDHLRPATSGAIGNLLLAGDWVDTGWPATMESAVRSGYRAAAAALRLRGRSSVTDNDLLAPSLKPGPLYRFMSG